MWQTCHTECALELAAEEHASTIAGPPRFGLLGRPKWTRTGLPGWNGRPCACSPMPVQLHCQCHQHDPVPSPRVPPLHSSIRTALCLPFRCHRTACNTLEGAVKAFCCLSAVCCADNHASIVCLSPRHLPLHTSFTAHRMTADSPSWPGLGWCSYLHSFLYALIGEIVASLAL